MSHESGWTDGMIYAAEIERNLAEKLKELETRIALLEGKQVIKKLKQKEED